MPPIGAIGAGPGTRIGIGCAIGRGPGLGREIPCCGLDKPIIGEGLGIGAPWKEGGPDIPALMLEGSPPN